MNILFFTLRLYKDRRLHSGYEKECRLRFLLYWDIYWIVNIIGIFAYRTKNADNAKREKDGKTNFGATGKQCLVIATTLLVGEVSPIPIVNARWTRAAARFANALFILRWWDEIHFLVLGYNQAFNQMIFLELTDINHRAILSDTGELAQAGWEEGMSFDP